MASEGVMARPYPDNGQMGLRYESKRCVLPVGMRGQNQGGVSKQWVDDTTWQGQQHRHGSSWGHRPQTSQSAGVPAVTAHA